MRERTEDIPALAEYFLAEQAAKTHSEPKTLAPEALAALAAQPWPGNVRELKNLLERLVILTAGQVVTVGDLPAHMRERDPASPGMETALGLADYKEAKAAFERLYLEKKLAEYSGNVSQTAEAVGLERSHLHKKLKSLGIKSERGED